jgi:hypothetical protein
MLTDQQPAHTETCQLGDEREPCPGCTWILERNIEWACWGAWLALFAHVPVQHWQGYGWG